MSIGEEIRTLVHAQPFEPFTIHTTDGKALHVKHPDYCFVFPNNTVAYVFPNDRTRDIVPVRSVARIELSAEKMADSAE